MSEPDASPALMEEPSPAFLTLFESLHPRDGQSRSNGDQRGHRGRGPSREGRRPRALTNATSSRAGVSPSAAVPANAIGTDNAASSTHAVAYVGKSSSRAADSKGIARSGREKCRGASRPSASPREASLGARTKVRFRPPRARSPQCVRPPCWTQLVYRSRRIVRAVAVPLSSRGALRRNTEAMPSIDRSQKWRI